MSLIEKIILLPIIAYQKVIGPYIRFITGQAHQCRFQPTCSVYAENAIKKYGLMGLIPALKRVANCHPFSKRNNYDPMV